MWLLCSETQSNCPSTSSDGSESWVRNVKALLLMQRCAAGTRLKVRTQAALTDERRRVRPA
jgi:hypothetical protein